MPRHERNDDSSSVHGVIRVRLTTVCVVLLCVALSSLASLAVVATVKEADALSTVALALAVLAFAAQLIVSLAQERSAASQVRDTSRINAETHALLSELRAQGASMASVQAAQFDKLLDRAITPAIVDAALSASTGEIDDDARDSEQRVEIDPDVFAANLRTEAERSFVSSSSPTGPKDLQLATAAELEDVLERFLSLSRESRRLLITLLTIGAQRSLIIDPAVSMAQTEELASAGFLRWGSGTNRDGKVAIRLMPSARMIAGILDASNRSPMLRPLRQELLRTVLSDEFPET